MRAHPEHGRTPLAIRAMFWLPFRKRYSRGEYAELFRIFGAETRALRRRPTYLLGLLVSVGLSLYFVIMGVKGASIDWWALAVGVLILVGYNCGINSAREHFCERLLRLKQHPEEVEGI